jgi:20S proteasome alpha/beta subunit
LTLIVGIVCSDGVVVASDSAATYGKEGVLTIGQQHITKIHKLAESMIFSSTGAIGIAQLIAQKTKKAWDEKDFASMTAPEEVMNKIGRGITDLVGPYLQTANFVRPLVGDASPSLCKTLVALPVRHKPCLFTFDFNGAPEQYTKELPFVALGSGQPIADPFLAFLKRLVWGRTQPTLAEGRLAAAWTIDHVRLTNPGGVGGDIQLATLAATEGKQPTVTLMTEPEIQEHLQLVRSAEKAMVEELRGTAPGAAHAPPPRLAQPPTT